MKQDRAANQSPVSDPGAGDRATSSASSGLVGATMPVLDSHLIQMLARLQTPVWVFDIDRSRVHWANAGALEIWRAPDLDELRARNMAVDMSESVARRLRQYQSDFERHDARFSELWTLYPKGQPRTLRVLFSGVRLGDERVAMLCEAVGEQQADPETLRSAEALLHTSVMITLYDEQGRALYRNPAARADVANPMSGLRAHFVEATDADRLLSDLRMQESAMHVCRVHTVDGLRWHRISARRCKDAITGRDALLLSEVDISDLKQVEAQARFLTVHDSLTGLPNRHFVNEAFQERLDQLVPAGRSAILMFIDLDNFKQINDTLGHATGDQLLCAMARRLEQAMRGNDLVARLGGDEFLVFTSSDDAVDAERALGERLLDALKLPVRLGSHELSMTASMGVARFPRDGSDLGTLMRQADLAMYGAKSAGRNRLEFFSESMLAHAQTRLGLEVELRRALERGEFVVHYQPRFAVSNSQIVGLEALVRWEHPQRGLILPSEFIAVCEETGLIVALGEQVLEQVTHQVARWHATGLPGPVAVNLSSRQFASGALLSNLQRTFARNACPPQALELEITESILLGSDDATLTMVNGLRELGCGVAVDDFGTGYSNLAYLQRLPLTCLKIDRSFIQSDTNARPLAEVIIALGHTLGLRVVAEGVETDEQLRWLDAAGCDEFQGFLRAPALPAEQLAAWLVTDAAASGSDP